MHYFITIALYKDLLIKYIYFSTDLLQFVKAMNLIDEQYCLSFECLFVFRNLHDLPDLVDP